MAECTKVGLFIILHAALVSDEYFNGDELDASLAETRKTDGWVGQ